MTTGHNDDEDDEDDAHDDDAIYNDADDKVESLTFMLWTHMRRMPSTKAGQK